MIKSIDQLIFGHRAQTCELVFPIDLDAARACRAALCLARQSENDAALEQAVLEWRLYLERTPDFDGFIEMVRNMEDLGPTQP